MSEGLRIAFDRIKNAYYQNKRRFIEVVLSLTISGFLGLAILILYSIWPPPTLTACNCPTETFQQVIVRTSPTVVHAFALLGLFLGFVAFSKTIMLDFIHFLFTVGIRTLKFYRSIKFKSLDEERLR